MVGGTVVAVSCRYCRLGGRCLWVISQSLGGIVCTFVLSSSRRWRGGGRGVDLSSPYCSVCCLYSRG